MTPPGQWYIKEVQPTAEGESQKVKLKVRVNIHGIIAVASASLVEKKPDANQTDTMEVENGSETQASQESVDANNGEQEQQNGQEGNEVRRDDADGAPEQKQSWTQRVGQWFTSVRVSVASVEC